MCYLAQIQPGQIILDPLGGVGTIAIEGSLTYKNSLFISGDINNKEIDRARTNISNIGVYGNVCALRLDATTLPFKDKSIDTIISDLPFGRRHGTKKSNLILYPSIFKEFIRTVKSGGLILVLTTAKGIMKDIIEQFKENLILKELRTINNGYLAELYILLNQ